VEGLSQGGILKVGGIRASSAGGGRKLISSAGREYATEEKVIQEKEAVLSLRTNK